MQISKMLIGVDVGGTKMEAAAIDPATGQVWRRLRVPTERDRGLEHVMGTLTQLLKDIAAPEGLEAFSGIGIGLPGIVHPQKKVMINGNTQVLIGHDVRGDLSDRLGTSMRIEIGNDANCFALAEALYGVGPRHAREYGKDLASQVALGIILGTGVGGGVVRGLKIETGAHGSAGEFGHVTLYHDGPLCYCGRRGHAESYLSGTGLERQYQELTGERLSSRQIFSSSDVKALELKERHKKDLARFMADLASLFDPDYFVLGGGVSLQDEIYVGLEEAVWARCFNPEARPRVYRHLLGDSAGVVGAALLSR